MLLEKLKALECTLHGSRRNETSAVRSKLPVAFPASPGQERTFLASILVHRREVAIAVI